MLYTNLHERGAGKQQSTSVARHACLTWAQVVVHRQVQWERETSKSGCQIRYSKTKNTLTNWLPHLHTQSANMHFLQIQKCQVIKINQDNVLKHVRAISVLHPTLGHTICFSLFCCCCIFWYTLLSQLESFPMGSSGCLPNKSQLPQSR